MSFTRHGYVDWQWQACSEPAAVSVARSAASAVSSVADTTQSSFWTPVPRVIEEAMPAMAHTWMVEGSEAWRLRRRLGGDPELHCGPQAAQDLQSVSALEPSGQAGTSLGLPRRRGWPALLLSGPRSITMRAHDRDDAPQPTAAARRRLVLPAVRGLLVLAAPAQS